MIIRENKKRNKGEDHHFYRKKKMENTKGSQNWETWKIILILATHKFICLGPAGSRIAFFSPLLKKNFCYWHCCKFKTYFLSSETYLLHFVDTVLHIFIPEFWLLNLTLHSLTFQLMYDVRVLPTSPSCPLSPAFWILHLNVCAIYLNPIPYYLGGSQSCQTQIQLLESGLYCSFFLSQSCIVCISYFMLLMHSY